MLQQGHLGDDFWAFSSGVRQVAELLLFLFYFFHFFDLCQAFAKAHSSFMFFFLIFCQAFAKAHSSFYHMVNELLNPGFAAQGYTHR